MLTFVVPPECGFTERLTFLVHDTCLQVRKWGASVPIPSVVFWHERHTCLLSKLGRLTHYFIFFLHPLTCPLKPAWYSANGFVTGSCGYEGIEYCRNRRRRVLYFFLQWLLSWILKHQKESILTLIFPSLINGL